MILSTPQQPEPQNVAAEQTTLPTWHQPTIVRIDIKRTLSGKGSGPDLSGPSL